MKKTVKAYAKINLMLDILGTLENGYHDLFMLMQSVSLFDEIEAETDESGKITVTCSNPAIPTGEKNIAYKAAESFFSYTEIKNPGIKIHIKKNIPHAAGLAGGSADAAGVIEALRLIFAPKLSDRDILNIGAPVGSDVPFCSLGGTMLAQYTGTALTYLPQLETEHIVIVKPPCSVSTGKAYAAFDSADRVRHLDKTGIFRAVMQGDRDGVYSRCDNVFEQFIDVPERIPIKMAMRTNGAKCCCMSGSGPSVFGIFETADQAENAAAELRRDFDQVFVCRSTKCGCEETGV